MKIQKLRMKWRNSSDIYRGVLMFDESNNHFIECKFGDGSNLSDEDEKAGYDDYIYIEVFETGKYVDDIEGIDGGQLMFNSSETDYYDDVDSFINDSLFLMGLNRDDMNIIRII